MVLVDVALFILGLGRQLPSARCHDGDAVLVFPVRPCRLHLAFHQDPEREGVGIVDEDGMLTLHPRCLTGREGEKGPGLDPGGQGEAVTEIVQGRLLRRRYGGPPQDIVELGGEHGTGGRGELCLGIFHEPLGPGGGRHLLGHIEFVFQAAVSAFQPHHGGVAAHGPRIQIVSVPGQPVAPGPEVGEIALRGGVDDVGRLDLPHELPDVPEVLS